MEENNERTIISPNKMMWEIAWRSFCIGVVTTYCVNVVYNLFINKSNYNTNMIIISIFSAIIGIIIGLISQIIALKWSFKKSTICKNDVKKILICELLLIILSTSSTFLSAINNINKTEKKILRYEKIISNYSDEYKTEFNKIKKTVKQEKTGVVIEGIILLIADGIIFINLKKKIEKEAIVEENKKRTALTWDDIENM